MKLTLPAYGGVPLENELVARVGWFIQLRWLAGAGVVAGATIAVLFGARAAALFPVGLAILGYNLLLDLAHRRLADKASPERWKLFAHLQIGLDWVALTALSALTGGLESPLVLFFTLHVIFAALLLRRRECLAQTTLGFLLIVAMAHGSSPGSPVRIPQSSLAVVRVYGDNTHVLGYILTIGGMLYLCALLASAITVRLRLHEGELLDARNREARMHAEMALLHELSKSITETLDLDVVLQRVADQAAAVTVARACSIRLLSQSGELPIIAAHGLSDAYLQKGQVDLARSPVDRQALLGETVQVEDVSQSTLLQYPEELSREGIQSLLCVPLRAQDEALGVIRVYGAAPRAFDQEDQRFLEHFASLAAMAIRNARNWRTIQETDRERARFMRTVAHELRSPLAAILGNLVVISQGYAGPVPERVVQLLERAHHRGTLLLALAGDLLALVSGREAPGAAADERLSLTDIVSQVAIDVEPDVACKAIDLQVSAGAAPVEVLGRRDQVTRMVENLVSNAVKYTPDGGRVSVALREQGKAVELVVEDTGIGIPKEQQAHLFQEFFRAENARRLTDNGTGLGLAIVKRIVENHHGTIALQSEEGKGTRVTVVLPRAG